MPNTTFESIITGGGVRIAAAINRASDGGFSAEIEVPHGFSGSLSTRTDAETGVLTLAGGHGISTGMIIDLFWTNPSGTAGHRRGITIGTVSGNSVPVGNDNSGSGDNLPTQGTAIVASARVNFNCNISQAGLSLLSLQQMFESDAAATGNSFARLTDNEASIVGGIFLTPNEPVTYDVTGGITSPVGGDSAFGFISNGSPSDDAVLKIVCSQDITPS
jgi:hypothetical protein